MDNVKEIRVGIADLNLVCPPDRIITVGLGSCVGIALYDQYKKIGGLAHIMLPDSTQFNNVSNEKKVCRSCHTNFDRKNGKEGFKYKKH